MKPDTQVQRDGKVIETLWGEMYDGLRTFISRRVTNEADTDDIIQEVFLRVHQRLDSLKDPRRVVGWIYQIVRNAIVDYYRVQGTRHDRPMGLVGDLETSRAATPSFFREMFGLEGQVRREMSACIRPMVAQLSQDYREAITMVELEGHSQRVAAQKIGLSLSGMKSRVQRGRKQLKHMLNTCCLIQLDRRNSIAAFSSRTSTCSDCASLVELPIS